MIIYLLHCCDKDGPVKGTQVFTDLALAQQYRAYEHALGYKGSYITTDEICQSSLSDLAAALVASRVASAPLVV